MNNLTDLSYDELAVINGGESIAYYVGAAAGVAASFAIGFVEGFLSL